MAENLETYAEAQAEKAESLPAFSGLKLLHIKRQVAILLGLIGRDGIFDEYTCHSISHINEMLKLLDWLIPEKTKQIMSPADWLLTVLAVYFHDLGMLVTRHEYESRQSSGFPEYRDKVLFAGDAGSDYRAKVEQLPPEKAERFLYQEFVRQHHAERIRWWVQGQARQHLGVTHTAASEVAELLKPVTEQFRRDLGLICESHHLDDLNDLRKYKVSHPYGNSPQETANVQYAANLLRTADLLHITGDRTPSIAFRAISPTDPVSQQEWAKQAAVTCVRAQIGRDKEGNPDEKAARHTIEVHAFFKDENGFFGLTSYLTYVTDQIRKCQEWVQAANRTQGAQHEFPWRYVDDTNIETEGFIKDQFKFTIDQARILDLLTGHTLYNDTRVVLRELVQNSLDAVRVQRCQDHISGNPGAPGRVKIHWDTKGRTLSVEDDGTGMTQGIIERHLLKVGASRYQDPEFIKQFPNFAPISRFGIGVLSAFMIADTVEITTFHPDEEKARQLSLRSVHGKYLIRLLDKETDELARRLGPHGTIFKLKVRPSVEVPDVLETAQRWVVVPGCEVSAQIDDATPVLVGYASPKDAVEDFLKGVGIRVGDGAASTRERKVKVEQKELCGVTVAYALEWSEYFREWSFLRPPEQRDGVAVDAAPRLALGTCVEGVRVVFGTPGFEDHPFVGIANATGPDAPKTNVARTGLEASPERDAMLERVYSIYCDHVRREMEELCTERAFSLTWATQESRYLLAPLLSARSRQEERLEPSNQSLLIEAVRRLPVLLVERDGERRAVSPADLCREPRFWTIDGAFFQSAEQLIREVQGSVSYSALASALKTHELHLPDGPIVCGLRPDDLVDQGALVGKEVNVIVVYKEQRRVDFGWAPVGDRPRWFDVLERLWRLTPEMHESRLLGHYRGEQPLMIGRGPLQTSGLSDEVAVVGLGRTYMLPTSPIANFITRHTEEASRTPSGLQSLALLNLAVPMILYLLRRKMRVSEVAEGIRHFRDQLPRRLSPELQDSDLAELQEIITKTSWSVFDPSAWARG